MNYLIPKCSNFSIIDNLKQMRGAELMRTAKLVSQSQVKKIITDHLTRIIKESKGLSDKKVINKSFTKNLINTKTTIIDLISSLA